MVQGVTINQLSLLSLKPGNNNNVDDDKNNNHLHAKYIYGNEYHYLCGHTKDCPPC